MARKSKQGEIVSVGCCLGCRAWPTRESAAAGCLGKKKENRFPCYLWWQLGFRLLTLLLGL